MSMKRMQKAIFAESSILEQYSCRAEQVPHLFLVKKEDNQELLRDLLENQNHPISSSTTTTVPPLINSTPITRHRVIHYDQRYYDHDVESKFCDVLVHPSGWKFYSFHRHILQEHEIQQLLIRMKTHLFDTFPSIRNELLPGEVNNDENDLKEKKRVKEWITDDHLDINGYKLHLPPVLFGIDVMFLEYHPNSSIVTSSHPQFALSVDPSDSIYAWVVKHCKESLEKKDLNIPKVPFSDKWMKNMHDGFKPATPSEPSTPLPITTATPNAAIPLAPPSGVVPEAPRRRSNSFEGSSASFLPPPVPREDSLTLTHLQASDWTYCTDYCLTLFLQSLSASDDVNSGSMKADEVYSLKNILRAQELPTASIQPPSEANLSQRYTIEPISASGINYEMLKRRDLPILFYDEILLYEDDLEDCGEVSMDAKIRVMPTCWFILMRFFVRIDNVIVRAREIRLFHEFPSPSTLSGPLKIFMEVIWREKDLAPDVVTPTSAMSPMMSNLHTSLATTSINTTTPALGTPTSYYSHHYSSSMPPPPMMMKKYTKDNIAEVPIINEKEGICPNYVIHIL